jgi:hypothetical protein
VISFRQLPFEPTTSTQAREIGRHIIQAANALPRRSGYVSAGNLSKR